MNISLQTLAMMAATIASALVTSRQHDGTADDLAKNSVEAALLIAEKLEEVTNKRA